MNHYEAPRRALEPVIDFGSVSDFEKSLLQKGKEGMQATLAYVFGAASTAVEKTFETVNTITGTTLDTLSTVAPAPVGNSSEKSIEGGAQ